MKCNTGVYQSQALKLAWGDFLSGLDTWDWWATLTFRDRTDEEVKRGWTKVGSQYSARAFKSFIKELQKKSGKEINWVSAREYQRWRGVPHYHALISGVESLRRLTSMDWWYGRYGIARIKQYDADKGAGWYISKYVAKELGEIHFSEGLTNRECLSYHGIRSQCDQEKDNADNKNQQESLGFYNDEINQDR